MGVYFIRRLSETYCHNGEFLLPPATSHLINGDKVGIGFTDNSHQKLAIFPLKESEDVEEAGHSLGLFLLDTSSATITTRGGNRFLRLPESLKYSGNVEIHGYGRFLAVHPAVSQSAPKTILRISKQRVQFIIIAIMSGVASSALISGGLIYYALMRCRP